MRVDALDGGALRAGVVECCGRPFQRVPDVAVRDVETCAIDEVGGKEGGSIRWARIANMCVTSTQCPYWAEVLVAVRFMMHTDPFPPILLVIEF